MLSATAMIHTEAEGDEDGSGKKFGSSPVLHRSVCEMSVAAFFSRPLLPHPQYSRHGPYFSVFRPSLFLVCNARS